MGMQLLLEDSSEFGVHKGLGIITGNLRKIKFSKDVRCKVPVVCWRKVTFTAKTLKDIGLDNKAMNSFYFVHSYSAHDINDENLAAVYSVGNENIVAMIKKNNVFGVQFHPERSGESGQLFLKHIFE